MHEQFPVHVADVTVPFRCVDAGASPGPALVAEFTRAWPSYRRWYLREGEAARPSFAECRDALREWMPELARDYLALVDAVGGGDLEARFLSHWCPPPLVAACSIIAARLPEPVLVRNYDYPPILCDALALRTHWSGRSVIGMADCALGLMDGVNDAGLSVAIAFGGRPHVGRGFGIGLVVRYLLQTCGTTGEAVERLLQLPVQMSYNVMLLDASGASTVVQVAPDRPARLSPLPYAANRQGATEWPSHAEYSRTVPREEYLSCLAAFPFTEAEDVENAFLRPPLFRPPVESTWGTVYTVAYEPRTGAMTLLWPDDRWSLPLHSTAEGSRPRTVGCLLPGPAVVLPEIPHRQPLPFLT